MGDFILISGWQFGQTSLPAIYFSTSVALKNGIRYVCDPDFHMMNSSMNLVDIASKYILLQPNRKALKGKCPFHKDETTSLLIIPQSNVFKCFGCGAEGGPMEFLMRIENKNRTKVIADIAEKTFRQ